MLSNQRSTQAGSKFSWNRIWEVLAVSTLLGLTSFGGPVAHLGYFHHEYVQKRRWLDERSYADLVALCQFLPGPASSQVGIGIGVIRAGLPGGLAAWLGFTWPSVIVLVLFAMLVQSFDLSSAGWLHGLKIVAVAVVAQAVFSMGQKLAPDRQRATLAILAAAVTLLWSSTYSAMFMILAAGIAGVWLCRSEARAAAPEVAVPIRRTVAVCSLLLFAVLLLLLPIARMYGVGGWLPLIDSFYRSGSLVFGGGHVVLPLLEREVVAVGWVGEQQFLAGYGAAQAVPGPLFTFAAYIGAVTAGISGAIIATIAIFAPAFLLVVGTLPFWSDLRRNTKIQSALAGINAAVVGILLAALYDPIWTTTMKQPADFVLAAALFLLLVFWKWPPWTIVIAGALGGIWIG